MITEDKLSEIVSREVDAADTWMNGELADQQADNLKYYFGEPFGNEETGFSQVVTRDVMQAVEGIMPELMKIFTSGDNFVEFEPHGEDDVEAAEQETDYVNYIFQRRCDGFSVLYNWFKDALLMKNGIAKVGWTEEDSREIVQFAGMTQEDIDTFEEDDELEVLEQEEEEHEKAEGAPETYKVRVRRLAKRGRPYVELIPSEEFRIRERSKCIKDADFVAHVTDKTIGALIEMGYDEDKVQESVTRVEDSQVQDARFSHPLEGTDVAPSVSLGYDKEVELIDAYIKLFDEDDRITKIFHVIQVGNTVLEYEETDTIPFINLSPIMVPHKFTGICVADLVSDIQKIRSQLYRNTLDNLALANAGRYAVLDNQVNLQDLIDNKIGGIVREKVQGAVRQLPTPQLGQATFPFLQELEKEKEDRVGVSKMTQGLDPNALTSNTAATAVNQIMSAAQQKILLIARVFAETGVKELFLHLHRLARTHQTQEDIVRLRGRFVQVDPFSWADRYDMVVTVGIGNGNKDQQLYHLNNIANILDRVGNTQFGYLIDANSVYNLTTEYIKNAGYKNTSSFILDPKQTPPPQPQPSPEMVEAQTKAQLAQMEMQIKQMNGQLEQARFELEQSKQQLEVAKFDWKKRVEAAEVSLEATQERPVGIGK